MNQMNKRRIEKLNRKRLIQYRRKDQRKIKSLDYRLKHQENFFKKNL